MVWSLHVGKEAEKIVFFSGNKAKNFAFYMHDKESNKQFHGVLVNYNEAQLLQEVGATPSSLLGASF